MKYLLLFCLVTSGLYAQQQPVEKADRLIAEAMRNLRNPPLAKTYADSAYWLAQQARYERGEALALKIRGSALLAMGNGDSGYYYQQKAWVIFNRLNDTLETAKVTYNMAIYHNSKAAYSKSLELSLQALSKFEAIHDRNGIGRALNLIGQTYYHQANFRQALSYFRLHMKNAMLAADSMEIASSWSNLGAVLGDLNENDSAAYYLLKAINLKETIGAVSTLGTSYFNLAHLYMDQEKFSQAENFFKKALQHYQSMNDSVRLAEYYHTHGVFLNRRKKYPEAVEELARSAEMAHKTGAREVERNALQALAGSYAALGNHVKAYEALDAYAQIAAELSNEQNAELLERMRTEFETERKELELAESKVTLAETSLRVQQRNNQLVLFSVVLLLLVIAGIWVYRNQRNRQRQLQVEAELKAQLAEMEADNALQQERLRISRELHDNIGSQLTFINSSLDSAAQSEQVSEVKKLTLDTIRELRRTVWLMNQPAVSLDEFGVKLREYLNQGVSLPVTVDTSRADVAQQLSSATATHLFRTIQEAVNNALKHARASQIMVELQSLPGNITVTIRDNGTGFSRQEVKAGYGIENMKSRMVAIGGSFELASQAGLTRIILVVPVS